MAYGDAEHPISFRFEPRDDGAHVRVVVRAGLDGMRAMAGELTLRPEEWVALRELLGQSRGDEELAETLRECIPADIRRNPQGLDYSNRLLLAGARVVHVDATPFVIGAP